MRCSCACVEERQLVGALSTSLEAITLTPEWHSEIARRLSKIEKREATFYDAEEHLRTLRAKHAR